MTRRAAPSLVIAAPASGSGKTTVTLALLRAFVQSGVNVSSFKVGPDYIDPAFHHLASKRPCFNLDPWAMSANTLKRSFEYAAKGSDLIIGEGVMGLFDGAQNGRGSTADLAKILDIPIILVVDAKGQAASVGALLHGFSSFRDDIKLAGVIFNSVGSVNHKTMLEAAANKVGIPILGAIPKSETLQLPRRHLGLVQARENPEIEGFLDTAAKFTAEHVDLQKLKSIATSVSLESSVTHTISPPGQKIAIAKDEAFAFSYPHQIADWKAAGAEITFFSPLNDETPAETADYIYLPGGYPELHADKLSEAANFKSALRRAAEDNIGIFGECGGYMVLGRTLTDKHGVAHPMLDLLPVETSFEKPKLHLGYRHAKLITNSSVGFEGAHFNAHEFHYASEIKNSSAQPLFSLQNAKQEDLGYAGAKCGSVAGSFIHLIDKA